MKEDAHGENKKCLCVYSSPISAVPYSLQGPYHARLIQEDFCAVGSLVVLDVGKGGGDVIGGVLELRLVVLVTDA